MSFIVNHKTYIIDCGPERELTDIDWYRSDSFPIECLIKACESAVDLDGHILTLTVNRRRNPTNTDQQQFSVQGINDGVITGRTKFIIQTLDTSAMRHGVYYYDIQEVDTSGNIITIAKNKFTIHQDITKTIPAGTPALNPDGTDMLNPDGSGTVNP